MNKKVIVFGATGNLGAYTVQHLKESGYDVIAVGHRKSDNGFFVEQGIPYYSVDICKKEDFSQLPQANISAVVHLAGELPARSEYNPNLLIESIVLGTLNVLEYMRSIKCKKIVFPQTPADVYYLQNSTIPISANARRDFPKSGDHAIYAIAKNAAVDLIELYHYQYNISRFILRFFTIYQYHPNPYHYEDGIHKMMPYRILMERAMQGEDIEVWGDPTRTKEIVYIKDFTQVIRKCIESSIEGGVYNVGSGNPTSLEEQIQGIIDIFSPHNKPSKKIYYPDKPNALLNHLDITKTQEELGYQPQYTYLEAMKDFYHEMQTEPFAKLWGTKEDYHL